MQPDPVAGNATRYTAAARPSVSTLLPHEFRPVVVSRVTTWSDGTVHVERPGEATQVVVPLLATEGHGR